MTVLYAIYGDDGVTAVELYCGDDVKYCEHFNSWQHLMFELSSTMQDYARVVITDIQTWNLVYHNHMSIVEGVN